MAQETTGSSGTTETKGSTVAPVGPATTEMTDSARDELALQLVDRLSLWSGAAGLIPLPLVDVAAVGGVQFYMLRRLSEIYGVPFSDNRGKSILASRDPGKCFHQRNQELAGDWNRDRRSNNAGRVGRCYLGYRQAFHSAFCFRRNPSRLQSVGLS
jgi:hypothetical protein